MIMSGRVTNIFHGQTWCGKRYSFEPYFHATLSQKIIRFKSINSNPNIFFDSTQGPDYVLTGSLGNRHWTGNFKPPQEIFVFMNYSAPDTVYSMAYNAITSSFVAHTGYTLNMTSQQWLTEVDFSVGSQAGSVWWHYLVVIVPDDVRCVSKPFFSSTRTVIVYTVYTFNGGHSYRCYGQRICDATICRLYALESPMMHFLWPIYDF